VDVRLVAATHRDLTQMVKRNEFRSDLYYRLNVFPILLPPLRERRDDIIPLVSYFVESFSGRIGKQIDNIPEGTLAAFEAYNWPGNIRELQNLIERAIILSNDGVLPNPLLASPDEVVRVTPVTPVTLAGTLRDSERSLILQKLQDAGWVIGGARGAAAKLGVKRTTLIAKMKKLGIYRPGATNDEAQAQDTAETTLTKDYRSIVQ
jgi:formate hydrogenlyase transcriptional activator